MKKVIFWDFDGTLAYSDSLWSRAVYAAVTAHIPAPGFTWEELRPHVSGIYTWSRPERDYSRLTGTLWWAHLYGVYCGVLQQLGVPAKVAERIGPEVRERILQVDRYTVYPDADFVLQEAAALGYKNYLLSNNYPEMESVLERLGLARHFSGVTVSALVGYDKPRRELYDYALRLAGHPEICLMVGDNPRADAEGAWRCGIRAALVHQVDLGRFSEAERKTEFPPEAVCETLTDLLPLLRQPERLRFLPVSDRRSLSDRCAIR